MEEKQKLKRTKRYTRRQAIKDKCLDCSCGQQAEVRRCPAVDCPLWRFRRGTEETGNSPEIEVISNDDIEPEEIPAESD